ncbi:MAG: hypothetical protein NTV24_04080 [Candidatus Woesebacteria bacterium]|nr:hypothetical protein [Candidatus Woesebacteria bacterium]
MISSLISLFANLWIYKIFSVNFLLGVLVLLAAILLVKNNKFFLLLFVPVLFFQIQTTNRPSLTAISNDDRRIIDMRLRAYPYKFLRLGYWLEERKESIIFNRVTTNLFENIDPNLYFFANTPRQRVGIKEFEKFPYVFLPFFFLGVYSFFSKKDKLFWLLSFFIPLAILSIIGSKNNLGPFSLFPFFVVSINEGLKKMQSKYIKIFIVVLVLVLIQIISYEIR